eukprot:s839_g25.t1
MESGSFAGIEPAFSLGPICRMPTETFELGTQLPSLVHLMASVCEYERADAASMNCHLGSGLARFGDLVKQHKNGHPFRFIPFWLVWWISCQSIFSGVAGEHSGGNMQGPGHAGFRNETLSDPVQLLQTEGRNIPSNCFLLEDHFHVDSNGVLIATLRFGPGGNAGPSDVKCIASRKVTEIVGSLSVTGALSLTSILLPKLERVRGSLIFMQLPKLVTQTFRLDGLKRVNENLVVRHNAALQNVSFTHLQKVDRTLEVGSNRVLERVSFNSLTFVGLHLLIDSNPILERIGATSLEEIRFDLIISSSGMQEIDFPSLVKIGEDLVVYVMDDLRSIRLPVLSYVGEDAEFAHLVRLQSLSLPALEVIGEDFEVHHCYSLDSLSMPSLQRVKEDVEIHNLPVCSAISMPKLSDIEEDLEMYNLDFWLYNMPNLSRVDFPKLAHVGGRKKSHPPSQSSCHYGFGDCDVEDEENSFYITNNTRLEHVRLESLVSIRNPYFAIFGNAALLSVHLPLLSKFQVPKQTVSCGLTSLFGVFQNEALTTLELNPDLVEPTFWSLEKNGPSFCPTGPVWATSNCGGGTVSVEDAEGTIFGCQCADAGFEADFLDGFCRQGQCPQYATRVSGMSTCSTCYDSDGCLVLSQAFVTVPHPTGGVAIEGSILLTSEDPLLKDVSCVKAGNRLTSIQGCLAIQWSPPLETINLQQLLLVNGSMTISGNVALHQIAAPGLEKIDLDLVIQGNLALSEVHFPALERVGGRLSLQGMSSLQSLELPALSQAGSVFLASNPGLEIFQFPLLRRTRSHLRMWQLNHVTTIAFPALELIGEDLVLSFCWRLERLNVLKLLEIREDLEMYVLHSLETISFPNLMQVGEDLELYTNDALTAIRFASLKLIGEDLEFFDNTAILEFGQDFFPNLEHVDEDFEVYLCAQLQSLDVPQLRRIDEDVLLFGNPNLVTVKLPLLEYVAAREGGGMLITDNLALTHLDLTSLQRVGNSTARIGSQDGSKDIRLYTGAFRWQVRGQEARPILIAHNPKLIRISFPQLEILNTGLWIQKNDKLQSINLDALKSGLCGQFFVIRLNPNLGKGGLHVPSLERDCVPGLVNLNCNSPDFCVENAPVDSRAGETSAKRSMGNDADFLEALRPKSVQELHASVAAAGKRKPLPPVVDQLQVFVEQRRACEERCVARLRARAEFEASLLPESSESQEDVRSKVTTGVRHRFKSLESQCSVLCGKRLSYLITAFLDANVSALESTKSRRLSHWKCHEAADAKLPPVLVERNRKEADHWELLGAGHRRGPEGNVLLLDVHLSHQSSLVCRDWCDKEI